LAPARTSSLVADQRGRVVAAFDPVPQRVGTAQADEGIAA
jgi:hypothetical protein